MITEDFDTIARLFGAEAVIRDSRAARVVLGFEPLRRAKDDFDLDSPRATALKAGPAAPQKTETQAGAGAAFAAIFVVLAVLAASVYVAGFLSAGVLVGLFGIPYAAFLVVYPAVVTLSGFLRSIPQLLTFMRLPKDRVPILLGGLLGTVLTLPATFYLAKWGVEGFGFFLPAAAKSGAYIAWNVSMAVDMKSVPDWMKESAPYVTFGSAIIGAFATTRARNKAAREREEADA